MVNKIITILVIFFAFNANAQSKLTFDIDNNGTNDFAYSKNNYLILKVNGKEIKVCKDDAGINFTDTFYYKNNVLTYVKYMDGTGHYEYVYKFKNVNGKIRLIGYEMAFIDNPSMILEARKTINLLTNKYDYKIIYYSKNEIEKGIEKERTKVFQGVVNCPVITANDMGICELDMIPNFGFLNAGDLEFERWDKMRQ